MGKQSLGKHSKKRALYKSSISEGGLAGSLACHCCPEQMVSACGWTRRLSLESSARGRSGIELVRQVQDRLPSLILNRHIVPTKPLVHSRSLGGLKETLIPAMELQ